MELLHIPNGILIILLEYVTHGWLWIASWGRKEWLIYSTKSTVGYSAGIALIALFLICFTSIKNKIRILFLIGLLLLFTLFFSLYKPVQASIVKIPCNNKSLLIIKGDKGLYCIDDNVLAGQRSAGWIEYGLSKELAKQCGTPYIETIVCTKLSLVTLNHLIELCKISSVKNIYLVTCHGEADKKILKKYGLLKFLLQKNKGNLYRIKPNHILSINVTNNLKIVLKTNEKKIQYNTLCYPKVTCELKT